MADPLIDTMAGNYRLVAKLGAGGMGEVYKGVHTSIGSKVAIKVLHAAGGDDAETEARFLREAQAVNLVDHDGIVKVLDAGRLANGRPFLVMELLEGSSLSEVLRGGPPDMLDACRVMADVLDALDAAHRVGVVHRDLKPANIFRTRGGRTVVLDFGIAKLLDGRARLTMMGMAVGTPHYMAPEQITDGVVGPAADIYTAGVVLFELLCARLPFEGATVHVMNGHLEQQPPTPRALRPDIPQAVSDVVLAALQKEPTRRFATAGAMRDALRAAMAAIATSSAGPSLGFAPTVPVPVQRMAPGGAPTAPMASLPPGGPPSAPVTSFQRPRSEPGPLPPRRELPTEQVLDTPRPVAAARAPRARWPWFVAALAGAGAIGVVAWKLSASAPGQVASSRDAGAIAVDDADPGEGEVIAIVGDAGVADAVAPTDAGVAAVDLRAAHATAISRARALPSMRARQMTTCLAPGDVGLGLPHEDDATLAEAHQLLARYRNVVACKHLRAYDDVVERNVREADELLRRGEAADALGLLRPQLAKVERLVVDAAFAGRRIASVQQLQRDPRVPDFTRGRMADLLRDAQAELAANQVASANLLLDEAAVQARKSIELRTP